MASSQIRVSKDFMTDFKKVSKSGDSDLKLFSFKFEVIFLSKTNVNEEIIPACIASIIYNLLFRLIFFYAYEIHLQLKIVLF